MCKNEICEEVFLILQQVFEDEEKLPKTFEESFSDKIDSIEFVMLVVEIESRFNIKIDDDDFEIENVDSVNSLADLIIKYKSNHS